MNSEGFDPSTLLIGYWNSMVSLKIHPALEKDKQTETKKFNYEKLVSTSISLQKAITLIEKIEKELLPAIESEENKNIGIPVGSDGILVIGTGKKITGSIRPYIAIHKSLNEKTKKPEMSISYEFNRNISIDDYDAEDGTFTKSKEMHSELLLFLEILKSSVKSLSGSIAHSMRVTEKFYKDRVINNLENISEKLGVATNKTFNKKNNIFNNGSDNNSNISFPNDETVDVEPLNNIEQIDSFLN
jgi:hypothetical protein